MLSDGIEVAADGTISQMGSMFVWIPRYAYQITSNYQNGGDGISGNINVKFLKDRTFVTTEETTTKMINASGLNNWNVHPAFTDGSKNNYANGGWDRELTGFWVAKFKASSTNPTADYGGGNATNLGIKVVPNVISWRNITITNCFTNCLNMNKTGNTYGLPTNAVTHLMKNSEWGAVAYLTQSKYGRNGVEIMNNNSSTYMSGNAANNLSDGANTGGVTNAYDTEKGILASTTGTVYGIFDIVAWGELVAGGLNDYIESALENIDGFLEKIVDRYQKVKDDGTGDTNYFLEANANRYGDSIYETSAGAYYSSNGTKNLYVSWNGEMSCYPRTGAAMFVRGLGESNKGYGMFAFSRRTDEEGREWVGFRPTIVIE